MSIKPQTCDRCGAACLSTIMSMFNTDVICGACRDAERARPDYAAARAADEAAIRDGNFNFPGIGLGQMRIGQKVAYTFYGRAETATIIRTSASGKILFLDNGRWMHAESCEVVQ